MTKKLIITQLYQEPIKTNSEPPMINIAEVEHTPLTVDDLKPEYMYISTDYETLSWSVNFITGFYKFIKL